MAYIDDMKARFFLNAGDTHPPTEPMPQQFDGCKITPLIDATTYNAALEQALTLVGTGPDAAANAGHFIFIHNWFLALSGGVFRGVQGSAGSDGPKVDQHLDPYFLDGPPDPANPGTGGTRKLIDVLIAKARIGVDVRVLGWASTSLMGRSIYLYVANLFSANIPYRAMNTGSMASISDLRADASLRPHMEAMLNVIAHTAAGAHTKMALVGTNAKAIGFTGGIDFANNRWAHRDHTFKEDWHDVVAQVEGPAVQSIYDWFQDLWNENLKRSVTRFRFLGKELPSFLPRTPPLPARTLPLDVQADNHSVQSLRTVPAFNYEWYNCLPENPPCSFAPKGVFEFRAGIRKALRTAERYIYMEDQAFFSQEILSWANEAIKANADLRVILLTNGTLDPVDPEFPPGILANAFNRGLLADLTPAQREQVRFMRRRGDILPLTNAGNQMTIDIVASAPVNNVCHLTTSITANKAWKANSVASLLWHLDVGGTKHLITGNPAIAEGQQVVLTAAPVAGACITPGTYDWYRQVGIIIHTKSTLVDDAWAIIGSANIMRRSLYSDMEHCVTMLDPAAQLVKEYRKSLWNEHFRHSNPNDFDDLPQALHAWEPTWGVPGPAPARPDTLVPISLPIVPNATLSDDEQAEYDWYTDVDSRQDWGGLCPPIP